MCVCVCVCVWNKERNIGMKLENDKISVAVYGCLWVYYYYDTNRAYEIYLHFMSPSYSIGFVNSETTYIYWICRNVYRENPVYTFISSLSKKSRELLNELNM